MVDERRRGVLGLALALGAAALYLSSLVNAYDLARTEAPSFDAATSFQSGVDWGRFVKAMAMLASPVSLVFLVGAVLLGASVLERRSGRVACWIVVVIGLFVGVGAAGGVVLVLSEGSNTSAGTVFALREHSTWYERTVAAFTYLATSFGATYAAWCAWQALAPGGAEDVAGVADGHDDAAAGA